MSLCKHYMASGCAYCHGREQAILNRSMNKVRHSREGRAQRYAALVEQAMHQEGSLWRRQAFKPPYEVLRRSIAKHKMGYAGN